MANTKKYVSLDKLSVYDEKIKKYLADADAAALKSAKDYADGLASNYDAAGSAGTAEANAKSYTDAEVAKANAAAATAQAAAEAASAAAGVADGKAVAAQGEVDALELYVGTIPEGATATDIVGYVQEKTAGIATEGAMTELGNRVGVVEGKVATIEGDYLKTADKTELEGKITAVQTAVDGEKTRAEGIEAGLRTDVDAIKADYLKAADKTELANAIAENAGAIELLTNGVKADEVDGVNDLIQYVKDHGTEVTGMQKNISDNAAAIAAEAARADAAEKLNAAAAAAAQTAADNAQAAADAEAARAAGVEGGLDTRLKAVEAAVGESGSVADDIATAKQAAIDAAAADAASKDEAVLVAAKKYADDEDAKIESSVTSLTEVVGTKAAQADLNTLAGRVTTAEGEIDTLQSEMDAVEALAASNKTAHEANAAAIALKADATALTSATDRITAIETWHENFVEVSEAEINALFTQAQV